MLGATMPRGKLALVSIMVGAVAGIVAGFLTAPKPGKEIRTNLKKRATELKRQASEHLEEVKEK